VTERPRAAAAGASKTVRVWLVAAALLVALGSSRALAQSAPLSAGSTDNDILAPADARVRIESITTRITGYDQFGTGYQSKAGPISGPGSERLTVFEPQLEIVATQGDRVTHRLWVPVDMVTAASPHSYQPTPDVTSGASRKLEGGTVQWTTTYKVERASQIAVTSGLHLENPFRSWNGGLSGSRALADQNTVVSGSVVGILDWFDRFYINGVRDGRTERSTTMASVGITQVLTPTTVAHLSYGLTVQEGELGNTWNVVPLANGDRGPELLPISRTRHALVARASQFLPWNGALRLYYRFYADDWGISAHSMEGQLMQRLTPTLYVGALYRFHTQTQPFFFTTLAPAGSTLQVADSDLARLQSQTIGGKVVGDVPVHGLARALHYEVEYDRYFRTNDLQVDIVSCALGLRF
jgi:uncharacterized protein DUF3570